MAKGYKDIYYNSSENQIYLKEFGSTEFKKFPYKHHFYIRCAENTGLKDVYGNNVKKIETEKKISSSSFGWTAENDISPETKFLEQYYSGQTLTWDSNEINVAFIDIECGDSDDGSGGFPYPEQANNEINLITVYSSKINEFHTFAYQDFDGDIPDLQGAKFEYHQYKDEKEMLINFMTWFENQKFDILTGWNIVTFDVPYIVQRVRKKCGSNIAKKISPIGKVQSQTKIYKRLEKEAFMMNIQGLTIYSYEDLYQKLSGASKPESWSLQWFGETFLGEGKLELDGAVNDSYKTNFSQFVKYNIEDVNLVLKLDKKWKYIRLAVMSCFDSRVTFDQIFSVSRLITGVILIHLHENNMVFQDESPKGDDWWHKEERFIVKDDMGMPYYQNCPDGEKDFPDFYCKGAVVEANPGLYHLGISNDIKSSYPHQILVYNVSPETKVIEHEVNHYLENDNEQYIEKVFKWLYDKHELIYNSNNDDYNLKHLKYKKYWKLNAREFQEIINEMLKDNGFDCKLKDFELDYIVSPINGVYYHRNIKGVVPAVVKKNFDLRKQYSKMMTEFSNMTEEKNYYIESDDKELLKLLG